MLNSPNLACNRSSKGQAIRLAFVFYRARPGQAGKVPANTTDKYIKHLTYR